MADRIKAILEAEDRASPVFRTLQFAIADLSDVAVQAAARIGRELVEAMADAVNAAADYEKATVNLAVALANQGENTKAVRDEFQAYARELTDVSQATENQILSALGQAKAMGASNEAAQRLIRSATDLAVFTGNQDQAFRQVIRTLGGYAGELGEVIPELKDLTSEQLRAGDAADIILQKFQGAGAAGARTFTGSVNNLKSAFQQLQVEIGGPVRDVLTAVNNTVFLPFLKTLRDAVGNSDTFRNSIIDAAIAVVQFAANLEAATRNLRLMAEIFIRTEIAKFVGGVQLLNDLLAVQAAFIGNEWSPAFTEALEKLRQLKDGATDAGAAVGNFGQAIGTEGDAGGATKNVTVLKDQVLSLNEAFRRLVRGVDVATTDVVFLGTQIRENLGSFAITQVGNLSSALVDGFEKGRLSFKDFLGDVLRGLARMLVQALIIRGIMAAFPNFLGGGGGAGGGGGGVLGFIPGIGGLFGSSVSPGLGGGISSAVLPAPTGGAIQLGLSLDPGVVVKDINDAVERGAVTITATRLKQVRNIR